MISQDDLSTLKDGVESVRKKLDILMKYKEINPREWDKAAVRLKADINKLKEFANESS